MEIKNIDTMDRPYTIMNGEQFVSLLLNLKPGEGVDWYDVAHGEQQSGYRAEKLKWSNSVILLMGGYGNEVLCCYLDDESYRGDEQAPHTISDCNQIDCVLTEFIILRNSDPDCFIVVKEGSAR